jgi:hypothetical protein
VIFLFLRNFWATVIPGIAIPLSLIATFGIMYLLGYNSLDNLSLMGLTIAVGFVVVLPRHQRSGFPSISIFRCAARQRGLGEHFPGRISINTNWLGWVPFGCRVNRKVCRRCGRTRPATPPES